MPLRTLSLLSLLVSAAFAAPTDIEKRASPTVKLDQGTFVGAADGSVNKFLGIPFGKPPIGNLRFNLPVAVDPYNGTQTVQSFGPACPQQAFNFPQFPQVVDDALDTIINGVYNVITPSAEDCLTLNVVVPQGTKLGAKLPVAVWIFGGGFELGGPNIYDGKIIVDRSVALGEPVIYVSMNYRVSAFGFLAGQEVMDAGVGNLGLQDQRLSLRWVQRYISAFGGDPTKVTIWGESAGAISVAMQMVTNGGNTEGLFRGAFMQSGSPIPVGPMSHGQVYYDTLVSQTGCSGASDTLQCMRNVDYATLKQAVDASPNFFAPQSLRLAWVPRVDGNFLKDSPAQLILQGSVANVPMISGDCDDEGTLFTLSLLNITTETQTKAYIHSNYIPDATSDEVDSLLALYPSDITQGSPYGTSILNALTPQYKRLAALQGDLVFQAPRRFFLQQRSGKQPIWTYLTKRFKVVPILGSFHGSDLLTMYTASDMTDYLINFVNNMNPNGQTGIAWPQYSNATQQMMLFQDGLTPLSLTTDTYRTAGMAKLSALSLKYPI